VTAPASAPPAGVPPRNVAQEASAKQIVATVVPHSLRFVAATVTSLVEPDESESETISFNGGWKIAGLPYRAAPDEIDVGPLARRDPRGQSSSAMRPPTRRASLLLASLVIVTGLVAASESNFRAAPAALFDDSHLSLTNDVRKGPDVRDFLRVVGPKVGRVALFGTPLRQDEPQPSDTPRSYDSFTDAYVALAYQALPKADRARFDPVITGFDPADLHAVDHVRRVLESFPGVFSGVGASASGPAAGLERVLGLAGEVGLVVRLEGELDVALLARHPRTAIVWAFARRSAEPAPQRLERLRRLLDDRRLAHVSFDVPWDELAKPVAAGDAQGALARAVALVDAHPTRFLFGTDAAATADAKQYFSRYEVCGALWAALAPEARALTLKGNYARLFDAARARVRAWEGSHVASLGLAR
jgi:hypothetical protein